METPAFARLEERWDGTPVLSLLQARPRLAARFHGPSGRFLTPRGPVDVIDPMLDTVWDSCFSPGDPWQPWIEGQLGSFLKATRSLQIPEADSESCRHLGYQDADTREDSRADALPWIAENLPTFGLDPDELCEATSDFDAELLQQVPGTDTSVAVIRLLPSRAIRVLLMDDLDRRLFWLRSGEFQQLIRWLAHETSGKPFSLRLKHPLWGPVLC